MRFVTENTRIGSVREVSTPAEIQAELPLTDAASKTVFDARGEIQDILYGRDDRLLVVVGPCSIHDTQAAIEYAQRLLPARQHLASHLLVVMRVYFEKPRTTVGWKGLINDPDLDDSFDINKGLRVGRELLLKLNEMGVPAGVEYLDILTPQYRTDLVAWGAIEAVRMRGRHHRVDGNLDAALGAVLEADRAR